MVAGGGASNPYSGVDAMAILLPLSLIGLGACIYYLFVGATLALPILIGSAVGMASHAAGNAVPASFIAGIVAFMLAVALGRFAALTLRSTLGRGMLMLLFACPAAFAGFFVTGDRKSTRLNPVTNAHIVFR